MTGIPNTINPAEQLAALASAGVNVVLLRDANQPPPHTSGINISATRTKKPRKPRRPTLASVAKQARKAGISIASIEIKADGSFTVITGKPEPAESENPWPLDEFRTKETKQ